MNEPEAVLAFIIIAITLTVDYYSYKPAHHILTLY